jgi:putative endopeptidase
MRHPSPSSLFLVALLPALAAACEENDLPEPKVPAVTPVTAASAPPPSAPVVPLRSIDPSAMDRSVRPGDEFFLFANGAWYAKAEFPADRSFTGVGLRVEEEAEARTRQILEEAANAKLAAGSEMQKAGDFYASYMDEEGIESRGRKPLEPAFARVAALKDARTLSAYLGSELRADVDPLNATNFKTDHLLGFWVEQDLNDPSRYAPYLLQGGLGLPDRSYYLDETPPMIDLRAKYKTHLAAMMRLAGIANADAKAGRVFALEKRMAEAHSSRVDSEDVHKGNNPWARKDFATKAPGMDWDAYFGAAKLDDAPSFIVWHPKAVTGLSALVRSEPLSVWKEYLTVRAIEHVAYFLPRALVEEHFAFYGRELRGVPTAPARWKRAVDLTNDSLGEAVGKVYVERFFPPESKKAVSRLVDNLIGAFARRIDALAWMAPATKAKAKEKLSTLKVGVGYPDAWHGYAALTIARGDAVGNLERAERFEYERNLAKLGRPIDRGEWAMVPHIVNAVNLPVRNALNFPAGILVPPFFDPQATAAINYGSIGAIIGHEISHSFDDQGAQFDAHGRVQNWWTPEDLSRFEASGAALAAQFDTYKPFPDVAVNGKQTLSENIADLAGLSVAYDAWRASLGGAPAPVAGGFDGDQQFFLSFGQGWQEKIRDARLRELLTTDGHAPARYRVLTVRNFDPWYAAFDVAPSNAMYLAPGARVRVW